MDKADSIKSSRHCVDCSKPISYGATRCRSCAISLNNYRRWSGNDPRREKLRTRNESVRGGVTPYKDGEWLRAEYVGSGKDLRKIAAEVGCSLRTIARWMEIHGITRRTSKATGRKFPQGEAAPNWQDGATRKAHTCPKCGGKKSHPSITCMSCRDTRGEKHPQWKGTGGARLLARRWAQYYWRPLVLERDNYTCRECGARGRVHAHHIVPLAALINRKQSEWGVDLKDPEQQLPFVVRLLEDAEITSIDNGIALCRDCHQKCHPLRHIEFRITRTKESVRQQSNTKLSLEKARLIRRAREEAGLSHKQLAKAFGVSGVTIYRVLSRRAWQED